MDMDSKFYDTPVVERSMPLDDEVPTNTRTHVLRFRRRSVTTAPTKAIRYANILRDLLLYALAFWGLVSIVKTMDFNRNDVNTRSTLQSCDCGNSVAEALSRGCKFDSLAMAWLPEQCRDDDLTAEFNTQGDGINGSWVYYADTAHTIQVPVEDVAAMGDDPAARVHMNKDWHQTHCLYYWLKLQRAQLNGKRVEPASDHEGHVRHCGMVFRQPGYGTISGVKLNTDEVEKHTH